MSAERVQSSNGKWVVLILILVGVTLSYLRWRYVPKSNPRTNVPGSPYYSPERQGK